MGPVPGGRTLIEFNDSSTAFNAEAGLRPGWDLAGIVEQQARLTPILLDSHLARRYPCILLNEYVEMLGVPLLRQACRRFRISKLVKGADEGYVVVSDFHESEGVKSWHMVKEGDQAFLHALYKLLSRPWNKVV